MLQRVCELRHFAYIFSLWHQIIIVLSHTNVATAIPAYESGIQLLGTLD
jgi:hypothetical protein